MKYYSLILLFTLLISVNCNAKQIKIAIVDSGYSGNYSQLKLCDKGLVDLTGTDTLDELGHGTNITEIIKQNLKGVDYCFYIIKIYSKKNMGITAIPSHLLAFLWLLEIKPDFINFSSSGHGTQLSEQVLIQNLVNAGSTFVVAAGNDKQNLDKKCDVFPACYSFVISVGNLDNNLNLSKTSNYGKVIKAWEIGENICAGGLCMSGTSQATARRTARLARKKYLDEK